MGSSLIQPSFTGGELAPALSGRVDLARYQTSARTMRNFIAQLYGGAANRPGFRFIYETKTSAKRSRLVPFEFSTVQTYVLEFGDQYIRVYKDGGVIEASPGVPVEIATTYLEDDIFELKFTQSADVLTITHNDYAPRQLSRTSHTAWTLSSYANKNGPFQDVNTVEAQTVAVSASTGAVTLTAAGVNLFAAHHVDLLLYLEDANAHTVKPWAPGQIGIAVGAQRRSDGKVYEAIEVATGGTAGNRTGGNRPTHDEGDAWDGDGSVESSGTYAEGVRWRYLHSGFGIVRITAVAGATSASGTVISRVPDSIVTAGNTYKYALAAWGGDQGYPATSTYHSERQAFGATAAQPQAYWMTKTGSYTDFGTSIPTVADDAISKSIPGRKVNAIRHMVEVGKLIVLTSGSEWVIAGDGGAISPSTIIQTAQSYNGSSHLPPIVVGDMALYLQDKGSVVRDIGYKYESDNYTGQDLTVLAAHLFAGKQIVDWAFAQVPWSVVWAVRSDGTLLGLTYMKEQQVMGWHRHDTDGEFESVCCISEGREDATYVIVNRTIDGATKRYVERMETRQFTAIEDAFFVDSGLSYDGRDQAGTLTLSGGTAWDHTETLTATLAGSAVALSSVSIGDQFVLTENTTDTNGDDTVIKYRLTVEAVAGATSATVRLNRTLPVSYRGANTVWDYAIRDVSGLSHLEAKTVAILADGNVHPQETVASGAIRLDQPAARIHVGLSIEADLETLEVNVPGGNETIRDKQKIIPTVRFLVKDTRGLTAGPDADHLYEQKQRSVENYDMPIELLTGLAEIRVDAGWNKQGRCFLRQSDPLPAEILAIIPDVTVAGA